MSPGWVRTQVWTRTRTRTHWTRTRTRTLVQSTRTRTRTLVQCTRTHTPDGLGLWPDGLGLWSCGLGLWTHEFGLTSTLKICKFWLEIAFLLTKWPPFLGVYITKRGLIFSWAHRMTALFSTKFYTNASYLCSPVGTYTSLSYSSAPRGLGRVLHCYKWRLLHSMRNFFSSSNITYHSINYTTESRPAQCRRYTVQLWTE